MRRRGVLRKAVTGAALVASGAPPYALTSLPVPGRARSQRNYLRAPIAFLALFIGFLLLPDRAEAHHILGRPAYNLNEDSNTPPSMQAEVQIGKYLLTYMIFPAFPQPGDQARINLYVIGIDDGKPFDGGVTFVIRELPWFSWLGAEGHEDRLGRRSPDDKVYRQGFVIPEAGEYLISARFQADGEPYVVDFPLRVGEPPAIGPFGLALGGLLVVLILVAVIRRRQSMTAKIRTSRAGRG